MTSTETSTCSTHILIFMRHKAVDIGKMNQSQLSTFKFQSAAADYTLHHDMNRFKHRVRDRVSQIYPTTAVHTALVGVHSIYCRSYLIYIYIMDYTV